MKVLIGVDGSTEALASVEFAADLFGDRPGVEFAIVHVVQAARRQKAYAAIGLGSGVYGLGESHLQELRTAIESEPVRILEEAAGRLRRRGFEPVLIEESGKASEGILRAADSVGADVIVLGRRGLDGLSRLLLGSVSVAVIDRSRVPVVVCPV